MAYNRGERPDSPMKRRGGRRRKKVCVFCGKENNEIDYKDVAKLRKYVSCISVTYIYDLSLFSKCFYVFK